LRYTKTLCAYLTFSFIATVLIILIVSTTLPHPISLPEKAGIASVFILCCIVGISFTLYPNWVRRYFSKGKNKEKNMALQVKRSFEGHHPDCPTFQNHTVQWKKKTWCAGCLGLFIGLCASILLMILYLAVDIQLTKAVSYVLLALGLLILPVVYVEILYQRKSAILHVFINSMLPISFFIITIAVEGLTGTFVYGFFTILLCFLWLDTRIQLSSWYHRAYCINCSESCKMYTAPV